MAALCVTSLEEAAGKSTICAGLGRVLKARGKKVGYVKAVCDAAGDRDVDMMKLTLGLEEPAEKLCLAMGSIKDDNASLKQVEEKYRQIAGDRDVVLIEGPGGSLAGTDVLKVVMNVAERTGAKVLLLSFYQPDLDGERLVAAARALGEKLVGVVINGVPEDKRSLLKANILPALEKGGVNVLGVLPEDRRLFGITIRELADYIGGRILNNEERAGEVVESLMVGALSLDPAASYLAVKDNKAVITGIEHADIQLAALNTSIKCLVVAGNSEPRPVIMNRARELKVPVIGVEKNALDILESLDGLFDGSGFYHEKKLEQIGSLLGSNVDLEAIPGIS
ncbi:MAG: phosphotransacetylase family protein [Dehalococcoidia bacterium]|nr:phosphotransacetylase family protein [Dehalococcoidia bacterium]